MNITKGLLIAVVIAGAWSPISALAQTQKPAGAPADAVMLVPGVWTTPEISAKCQAYAAKRVGTGPNTDNIRQTTALACAKKLWDRELAKGKGKKSV